ncbi:putative histone-lysine N-methyltransferase 1 isoform X2 [Mytilus californianus]|uniref:putative histone-lysine N-methyltransferase 1 isoform X2 n=1 Tax=Mytilus californianus TaxID=6549 RepID=UPI0022478C2D|nr:putative histone-lysine N-methyltransferase 1 isoform X2 [Mytilus californianus]
MMQKDTLNKFMKVQQDKRENTCVCSFCLQMFDNLNDLQDHLILHDPLNLPNGQYNDCMDTDCVNDIIDLDLRNSMKKYGSKLTKTKQNYSDKQQSIQTLLQLKNVRFKRKRDDDEKDDNKDYYTDDYDEEDENDDDDDDDDEEEEDDYSNNENDDDDDEEEEDSDYYKDDDDDEEIESLDDEKNGDEWKEQEKGVKRGPDKMCAKKEEEEKKDNETKEIDHVAHTESVRHKLLMQSDILRRLETKSQDGKMTVEKSTQTGSVNEDSNQGCCQCRTCSCKCHAHLRNDMQNALKCSKQMFQSNIFPKEKDKKRLLTKTLTIQTVNKWFINYRYHFFLHIKKHAADTITSKSTTVEINRLTNKHYAKCFQCVSKKPKRHSKQQVKRAFMAWRYALQTNINPEKYMRQALKS